MKLFLKALFHFIFVFMVVMTMRTSLHVSICEVSSAGAAWAWATLKVAYFGFVTFFCWVAWRERSLAIESIWFILILLLGNIAGSFYLLAQIFGRKAQESVSVVFGPKAA